MHHHLSSIHENLSRIASRYWVCVLENRTPYNLISSDFTEKWGRLQMPISEIIHPSETREFVWLKTEGTPTGASGVLHFQVANTNRILNVMASIPFDWNIYSAWCNVCITESRETFDDLYNGTQGCVKPVVAGKMSSVDGCSFYMNNKSQATFLVTYNGNYN